MWNLSGHLQNLIIEKMSETVNTSSKNSENFIDVAALTAAKKRPGSENMEASEIRKPPCFIRFDKEELNGQAALNGSRSV